MGYGLPLTTLSLLDISSKGPFGPFGSLGPLVTMDIMAYYLFAWLVT